MIQGDKHQVSRGGLGLARLLVMGLGVGKGRLYGLVRLPDTQQPDR
jgi:hypothetical protein